MEGWLIPPPKEPTKSRAELQREREEKVKWLARFGYLHSERIKQALLKVRREDFVPKEYRDYSYLEVPLPLPGQRASVSCPHSYPLFYEPLGLSEGHRFLEVGAGSGYGAALAREIVGATGLVVSVEIDPVTYGFAKSNLTHAGYNDIVLACADGGQGYPELAPYDRICVTAACGQLPPPLVEQLQIGGRLIVPLIDGRVQTLTLFEKQQQGMSRRCVCEVLYVNLQGRYGMGPSP